MGSLVEIELKFPDYLARIKRAQKRIYLAMASDVQTNRGLLFDREGAYNGHDKWQDLASGKNLKRAKNGLQVRQILRKSGALKNSLAPEGAPGRAGPNGYVKNEGSLKRPVVRVGTNLKYARIHNEGGVIKHPGSSNGFGKGIKIPAHDIPIPKRNFTDWLRQDNVNMGKMLKNLLAEILNGR